MQIWGSHSHVSEELNLLQCDAVLSRNSFGHFRVSQCFYLQTQDESSTRLKYHLLLTYELCANCCQARLTVVTNTIPLRGHSSPITGGISGMLISWCCPALPVINIEFVEYPWVFLPSIAFLLFGTRSRHEEAEGEFSLLSGPVLQALTHKVSFVSDHNSSYQAQIVQQSASCLNLWSKTIFLYHLIGVKGKVIPLQWPLGFLVG
jgi:hypothetical protein